MVVRFVPTNDTQSTDQSLFQVGAQVGPYTVPVIGNGGFGGPLESGELGYQIAGSGANFLNWMDKEVVLARWKMDDYDAVLNGINQMLVALAADEVAIDLYSDGSYSVPS